MPLHFSAWVAFLGATRRGTSQPTVQIFGRIFGRCNLRTAIDFAVLRMRCCGAERMEGQVVALAGLRCMDGGVADASGDECLE